MQTFRLLPEGKWEQPATFTLKFCSYKSRQYCCSCIWLLITCREKAICPVRWQCPWQLAPHSTSQAHQHFSIQHSWFYLCKELGSKTVNKNTLQMPRTYSLMKTLFSAERVIKSVTVYFPLRRANYTEYCFQHVVKNAIWHWKQCNMGNLTLPWLNKKCKSSKAELRMKKHHQPQGALPLITPAS